MAVLRLLTAGFLFIIAVFFSILFTLISIPLVNDLFVPLPTSMPITIWVTVTPLAPKAGTIVLPTPTLPEDLPIPTPTLPVVATLVPILQSLPTPPPEPTFTPMPTTDRSMCDPSYPTLCIPPGVGDIYDCDSPIIGGQTYFTVYSPDPQRFDGNNNGVGCEKK